MHSDDRLARRAADGDDRAFAAIFRRYHQDLYRFCLAILGNPQDAQDALQSTMVKALRALPGEERRIELKPWLYRVAHNESIELLRRRRDTDRLDVELAAPDVGLAEEVAVRERLRCLFADLAELPERQRQTLIMRELAGLEFAEIGAALGTSAAVARQTVYEARLSLRQMDEGREMNCEKVTKALSDGDGRVTGRRDVRAHLRSCASCRGFGDEIAGRERDLAALSPLPVAAAAGLLQGLLGGHGGGGAGAALGGGGAAGSVVFKGAATVAVVAALGAGAADRGGLIDLWPADENSSQTSLVRSADGTESSRGEGEPAIAPGHSAAAGPSVAAGPATGEARRQSADPAASPAAGDPKGQSPAASDGAQQAGTPAGGIEGESASSDQGGWGDPGSSSPSGEEAAGSGKEEEKDKGQGKAKGHEKEKQKDEKKEEKEKAKDEKAEEKGNSKGNSDPEKGPPSVPPGQEKKEESAPPPAIVPEATGDEAPPGHGKGKGKNPPAQP